MHWRARSSLGIFRDAHPLCSCFSTLPHSLTRLRPSVMQANRRPEYIVEHMEEDDPDAPAVFPRWALLEYGHMLQLLGPGATLHFTSLSLASLASLQTELDKIPEPRAKFQLHTKSFTSFTAEKMQSVCLLDPAAPHGLSVCDAGLHTSTSPILPRAEDGPFAYFLFGGILGDDPPRDRTSSLRKLGMPRRHLGKMQMTTDTALGVTKCVVEDGKAIALEGGEMQAEKGKMRWCDAPELKFGRGESVSSQRARWEVGVENVWLG